MKNGISVIIPILNSGKFIEKAVDSVLIQSEVDELIIVDDGSTDNSLSICNRLAKNNEKIKIFQHQDKKNHGRSASRNLGIKKAKGKFVAFLDADDYYLPNRFKLDLKILNNNAECDGVYNAISAEFYRQSTNFEKIKLKLTTLSEKIEHCKLFEKIGPIGHNGYFSGIGLTVRRNIFDKVGYFNSDLEVAEDTELWLKMTLITKLKPGNIKKAVAMRGVHDNNISFKNEKLYLVNNLKMYESLFYWSVNKKIVFSRISLIWKKIWIYRNLNKTSFKNDLIFWIQSVFKYPKLLLLKKTYSKFPIFSVVISSFKKFN